MFTKIRGISDMREHILVFKERTLLNGVTSENRKCLSQESAWLDYCLSQAFWDNVIPVFILVLMLS